MKYNLNNVAISFVCIGFLLLIGGLYIFFFLLLLSLSLSLSCRSFQKLPVHDVCSSSLLVIREQRVGIIVVGWQALTGFGGLVIMDEI